MICGLELVALGLALAALTTGAARGVLDDADARRKHNARNKPNTSTSRRLLRSELDE